MKLILSSIVSLILLVPQVSNAGGSVKWHDAGVSVTADLQRILISAGKCTTLEDCTRRHLVFFHPVSEGLEISLYELSTTDREVVAKSLASCGNAIAGSRMKSIDLTVFASSKEIEMKKAGFFGERPAETYKIRGSYADR